MSRDGRCSLARRRLVEGAALAAAGCVIAPATVLAGKGAGSSSRPASPSRVVLIRDRRVFDGSGSLRPEIVREMLDAAVTALVGERRPLAAWRSLIRPGDVVGIKSNAWRYLPTPRPLEQAILARLEDVGVPADRRAVDDRGVLGNPVFQGATALVNVRPMRTHHWAGVGSLIKNYIMFVPEPSACHADSCADLGLLWKLPLVAGKTRLNVLALFTPQFHGVGPHNFHPRYLWRYGGLAVGLDPVAVDAVGLRILEARRRAHFGEERPFATPPKHIALADTRHGLGHADAAHIDLVMLGDAEGRLISGAAAGVAGHCQCAGETL